MIHRLQKSIWQLTISRSLNLTTGLSKQPTTELGQLIITIFMLNGELDLVNQTLNLTECSMNKGNSYYSWPHLQMLHIELGNSWRVLKIVTSLGGTFSAVQSILCSVVVDRCISACGRTCFNLVLFQRTDLPCNSRRNVSAPVSSRCSICCARFAALLTVHWSEFVEDLFIGVFPTSSCLGMLRKLPSLVCNARQNENTMCRLWLNYFNDVSLEFSVLLCHLVFANFHLHPCCG